MSLFGGQATSPTAFYSWVAGSGTYGAAELVLRDRFSTANIYSYVPAVGHTFLKPIFLGIDNTFAGELTIANGSAAFHTRFLSGALGNYTLTWPTGAPPIDDYCLTGKMTGILNWATCGAGGSGPTLQTNGTNNGSQTLLNLVSGTNVAVTDDGIGDVTVSGYSFPGADGDLLFSNGTGAAKVFTAVNYGASTGLTAPSFNSSGTTTGTWIGVLGTGSLSALPSNSAGFSGPLTGGTSYLFKMPATITAGVLTAAAPGTLEGDNQSQGSITPVATTTTANALVKTGAGGFIDNTFFSAIPLSKLATQTADTLVMNATASTAVPTAVAIPSCAADGLHALTYPSHVPTCTVMSAGSGLADPGANGVMTRTSTNVTAPADAAAMATPAVATAVGGTANAITATMSPALAAQTQVGTIVRLTPTANNSTTTPTLAVSGLTALTIKKKSSAGLVAVASGDIVSGQSATFELDPSVTFWVLTNPQTAAAVTETNGELCHNYSPGSGQATPPAVLISCTPSVSLVVGAHYRVVAGVNFTTSSSPSGAVMYITQGGLVAGGGTALCITYAANAPAASTTFTGTISCEFTVTTSSASVGFGGGLLMAGTSGANGYNKGMAWDNSIVTTTTGTPTIDIIFQSAGTNNTWTGENIVVYRTY